MREDAANETGAHAGSEGLHATGVSVSRGGSDLLTNVSLSVRAGEVLTLLGPNGAGKSTLLGVLAGDMVPDDGTVTLDARPLDGWSLLELSRRRSVLLQDQQVMFPFTVHQVVEMGRAPWRRTPREDEDVEAIAEALSVTDVAHLGNRRVPSLSGGERARVALARILAGRTGILMLDEPTAALDLKHQEAVLRIARERAAQGDAVLVVLHDLNLASAYADRVALLRDGAIVALGSPNDVLTADKVSAVYDTPVEVVEHPGAGAGIVMPIRPAR